MNIRLSATQVSRDRWLISYAAFMTLLCAFFMTVYAATLAEPPAATAAAPVEVTVPAGETAPEPSPVDPAVALREQVERALAPEAQAMLSRVATMLTTLPNAVRIEGHSDTTPIRTPQYASNWDLSTARATRVVEFLVTTAGLAPSRLSAAGYAEFKPRASNDTPTGRARNRRVDLVLLNDATTRAEEPAGSARP